MANGAGAGGAAAGGGAGIRFGRAGTVNVRVSAPAATIGTTRGEYIACQVTVEGAEPLFTFSCRHRAIIREAKTFEGHPKKTYQWSHFRQAGDEDAADDVYVLTFVFTGATRYSYLMEHCHASGTRLAVLKQLDFASTDPTDTCFDGIRLFTE